jgi:hypothetical protein
LLFPFLVPPKKFCLYFVLFSFVLQVEHQDKKIDRKAIILDWFSLSGNRRRR